MHYPNVMTLRRQNHHQNEFDQRAEDSAWISVPNKVPTAATAAVTLRPEKRASPHGLRVAAIDIGTNSLHMVVVEVTDQLSFRVLASEKDMTQLGSEALVEHHLSRAAMEHSLDALSRYQLIATRLECDVVLAYATSAVRESDNGGDFVSLVRQKLHLPIQVISAEEEARLIYLAVRQAVDLSPDGNPALIVDIGGGSCEIIVGTNERGMMLQSRKLGASRLTQQFIKHDPPTKNELESLEEYIDKTLKPLLKRAQELGAKRVIGTSGTMENLAAMCHQRYGEESQRQRLLTEMRREDFKDICKLLRRGKLDERREIPGLDPGRAGQIIAGAAVVDFIFDKIDAPMIEVCDRAMREGMIIDYMQTHWPKIRLSVQIRDPRKRSVIELGRRCNFDERHANKVAVIALRLFDEMAGIHKLDGDARELLEYAALLHDIGWHIGHSGHHKHSWYLIKNGDLEGFSPHEIDIMANVARYHRKSLPKKNHEAYMALNDSERELVCQLAAILRIADGLDRGHYSNVTDLKVICRRANCSVIVTTHSDPELELWGAAHKTDLFERVYDRQVIFSARQVKRRKVKN